ncbi:hypothetical protein HYV43_03035 [Candidatus Micrarchaeota archaeon]|nr:hypothetical protein [Candidatus Micrarchaeota archaeon]
MRNAAFFTLLAAILLFGCVSNPTPAPVPTVSVFLPAPSATASPTASATAVITAMPSPTATPTDQGPPSDIVYADYGQKFTLIEGQRAVFEQGGVLLWFTNVSDSRCPTGVQCIWAGVASVKTSMQSGAAQASFTLIAGQNATAVTLNGPKYLARVESVTPYPAYPGKIPLSDYRVTFTVVKK